MIGLTLGLGLLEIILRLNAALLIPGMGAFSPISLPLADQTYEVHLSDGDLFTIQPGLVQTVSPADDQVVAWVHYQTDEFGFPNSPPLSGRVDIVVLGRSYSLGAQSSKPWPQQLAGQMEVKILNLAQSGSSTQMKQVYFERFAVPRRPRWVVIEVLVPMDVMSDSANPSTLVESLPYPLIFSLVRQAIPQYQTANDVQPVFPVRLSLPEWDVDYAEFVEYLEALSVDNATIQASQNWAVYIQQLSQLIRTIRDQHACPLLLYAPTKSDIYLPLVSDPAPLEPVIAILQPYRLETDNWFVRDPTLRANLDGAFLQANAAQRAALVKELAESVGVIWVDPSTAMRQAAAAGIDPFMSYDSHWSLVGHQLVAQAVAQMLQNTACP